MSEVEATTYVLSNYHDNELNNVTGIDYCTDFYVGYENESVAPATEATFNVSGPFYQTPPITEIYYTWNVTYTSNASGKTYYLYWKAHLASGSSSWSGAKLHAKTGVTGAQDVPIAVPPAQAPTTTTTLLSATTIPLGGSVTDTATVMGTGPTPTGTVTFYVGAGQATSDSYTPPSPGTYYFYANYSGDSNYLPSVSDPADEVLVVGEL